VVSLDHSTILVMRPSTFHPGPLLRLTLYVLALWLLFEVTSSVHITNQRAGLYPPEADSVSIPIYTMAFFFIG